MFAVVIIQIQSDEPNNQLIVLSNNLMQSIWPSIINCCTCIATLTNICRHLHHLSLLWSIRPDKIYHSITSTNYQVVMKSTLTLLLTLFVVHLNANYNVSFDCISCFNDTCLEAKGGVFNRWLFPINCSFISASSYSFNCDTSCIGSCSVTINEGAYSQVLCSNTSLAMLAQDKLNILYEVYTENLNSTYNWCNNVCGGGNPSTHTITAGAIAGIVIGCSLGIGIIVGVILVVNKRKQAQESLLGVEVTEPTRVEVVDATRS